MLCSTAGFSRTVEPLTLNPEMLLCAGARGHCAERARDVAVRAQRLVRRPAGAPCDAMRNTTHASLDSHTSRLLANNLSWFPSLCLSRGSATRPGPKPAHSTLPAQAHLTRLPGTEAASVQVRPWLADVSADLHAPDGALNQVEYYGLYRGRSPQPQSNPGYIMMQSNLVVYGSAEGGAAASGQDL